MSLLSIKDFYPSDLLSDLKLKPWWETLRGFGYVAGVASMLSLLIATFPRVTVSCLSVAEYSNELTTLTTVQAAAINSYCVRYVPWYIKYSGLLALSVMVLLYLSEVFWTLVPGVRESLKNLSKISEKISEINMRVDEMKNQSVLPITKSSSEKYLKLREIVMLLIQPFNSVNVMSWYVGRSFILFAILVTLSGLNLFAYFEFDFSASFLCDTQNDFVPNVGNATSNFSCIINASSIYLLIYSIALAFQAFFMFVGLVLLFIWSVKNAIMPFTKKSDESWNQRDDIYRKHALKLLSLFLSYRNPDLADDVRSFTEFVLSIDFRFTQSHVIDEAIIANDFEFFRILKIAYEKTGFKQHFATDVSFIVELVLRDAENPKEFKIGATEEKRGETDADYKILKLLLNLFPQHHNHSQEEGKQEDELLQLSINWGEDKKWHILACSPIFYTNRFADQFEKELFNKFDIKFDQLDKEGRSFLFYALRNSSLNGSLDRFDIVFNILLQKKSKSEAAKFVHFDGRSMLTKDFIQREYCYNDRNKNCFRGELPNVKLCDAFENKNKNYSQSSLDLIYETYKQQKSGLSDQSVIVNNLERIKFRSWSKVAVEFAKAAYDNAHFCVFVALLNSYIVTDKERRVIGRLEGCGIYNFDSTEILTEALKRPTGKPYFVPTAARHMLACFTKNQREKSKFHIENSDLAEIEQNSLEDFIEEMNKNNPSIHDVESQRPNGNTGKANEKDSATLEKEVPTNGENVGTSSTGKEDENKIPTDDSKCDKMPSVSNAVNSKTQNVSSQGNYFKDGKRVYYQTESYLCQNVDGDGSCFFRAVIDQLTNRFSYRNWDHESLREKAVDELQLHPDSYMGFTEGASTVEKYQNIIKEWKRTDKFATHPLIQAAAEVIKCSFTVIKSENDERTSLTAGSEDSEKILYLGLENEHYWSLYPVVDEQPPTDGLSNLNENKNNSTYQENCEINTDGQLVYETTSLMDDRSQCNGVNDDRYGQNDKSKLMLPNS